MSNNPWIPVNNFREIPEGNWFIWFEEDNLGKKLGILKMNRNRIGVVDGCFVFDMPRVVAYKAIDTEPYEF